MEEIGLTVGLGLAGAGLILLLLLLAAFCGPDGSVWPDAHEYKGGKQ